MKIIDLTTPNITNALDAEAYTRRMCEEHFDMLDFGMKRIIAKQEGRLNDEIKRQSELTAVYNAEKSKWCKNFFSTNFPRLLGCQMGKVLMGEIKEDMNAYRHRTSEF